MTGYLIPVLAAGAVAARDNAVLDAFSAVGADAPSRAVSLAELPPLDPDDLGRLIERGAVREGAPGTFYRYVSTRARGATPTLHLLLASAVLVSMLLLLVAVLVIRRTAR
jgi:hypothetical protein